MVEVGQILRQSREEKGISLKQVEQALKIRCKFLSALENDERINSLSEIYVNGFLRSYALYLGLDADHIMQLYAAGREPVHDVQSRWGSSVQPSGIAGGDTPDQSVRSRFLTLAVTVSGILLGFVILAVAISFIAKGNAETPAGVTSVLASTEEASTSLVMSDTVTSQLTPEGTPTATPRPTRTPTPTMTPTVTDTPTPEFYTGVNIELIARANAWTQIRVDGKKVFEGMLEPGMRKHWRGEERVEVRCGNAGGVEAFVNGESIGLLGEDGQVIDMEWQKEMGTSSVPLSTPEPPPAAAAVETTSADVTGSEMPEGTAVPTG